MYIFGDLFIMLTAFFESIFSENEKNSNIKRGVIQILYAIVFSIIFGVLLGIIVIMALGAIFGMKYVTLLNLMIMPIFIFIILFWIIISNYKNEDFRLSRWFLKLYFLTFMIKPMKKLKQSIIYTLIMPVILFAASVLILSSISLDTNKYISVAGLIFIITFFISILLYSESQSDKLDRYLSQFCIWFIIFLGFLVLNIYQYSIYLSSNLNRDQVLNLLILILSFAFVMTTIADKTRYLYELAYEIHGDKIDAIMETLKTDYSYKKYVHAIENEKNEILQGFGIIKNQWNGGNKIKIIKTILYVSILEIPLIYMLFNEKQVSDFMNMLMNNAVNIWIYLFKGNKKLASVVFFIILSLVILCLTIKDTIKNFKVATSKVKMEYINKIILILIIIVTVTSSLFSGVIIIVTKYITFPLVVLFVLGVIIQDKVFNK
ncbi:hypothetical protein [Haloimpatiens massiliensis]|uniref:hypothetical protein n=1 Tax=Haloimpatiens massiliensis TaxID=1658110 RepID=UPI000C846590|nr:hypothetical protein [Haloimpatiens massiliensis]